MIRLHVGVRILLGIAMCLGMIYSLSHPVPDGVELCFLWGSIGASASGSFNVTFIPQFIGFTISSAPTSFVINVQGDGVIFNLDATGMTAMKNIRLMGIISNTYVFQLANGLVNGKNGTVTITNAAAAQLDVQYWSKMPGNMYMVYNTQNALASSGVVFRDFAYAAFPSAAAADRFTIEYNSGINQVSVREDLNFGLQYTQNEVTSKYNLDNIAPAMVKAVTFNPVAAQNVYVMNYQGVKGAVSSAVLQS